MWRLENAWTSCEKTGVLCYRWKTFLTIASHCTHSRFWRCLKHPPKLVRTRQVLERIKKIPDAACRCEIGQFTRAANVNHCSGFSCIPYADKVALRVHHRYRSCLKNITRNRLNTSPLLFVISYNIVRNSLKKIETRWPTPNSLQGIWEWTRRTEERWQTRNDQANLCVPKAMVEDTNRWWHWFANWGTKVELK